MRESLLDYVAAALLIEPPAATRKEDHPPIPEEIAVDTYADDVVAERRLEEGV